MKEQTEQNEGKQDTHTSLEAAKELAQDRARALAEAFSSVAAELAEYSASYAQGTLQARSLMSAAGWVMRAGAALAEAFPAQWKPPEEVPLHGVNRGVPGEVPGEGEAP